MSVLLLMHIIWSALPNLQHNRLLRLSAATPVRVSRDGEPRTPSDHGAAPGLCRSQSRRTGDCAPRAVLGWEGRTMSTAQGAERTTHSATLPLNICARPVLPCVLITIRSIRYSRAIRQISVEAFPHTARVSMGHSWRA